MSDPRRPMRPEDLTNIAFASDPQLSPDGARVAFVVTRLSMEQDEALSTIHVVDVATREVTPLTTGPKRDTAPRWSPDGRSLAFLSEREKRKAQLFVMPAGGFGEARRLSDVKEAATSPVWSPDGRFLAFVARVPSAPEPDDEAKSRPARIITTLKYKADGEGFVHDRWPHVFVVRADGSAPARQVTQGDYTHAEPAWSPDGRTLAFVSARHERRDRDNAADVWALALEDGAPRGEPRRLTGTRGPVRLPAFSPDGDELVYAGHEHLGESAWHLRLRAVSLAAPPEGTGQTRCLTERLDATCTPFFSAARPLWLRDGVVFTAEERGDVPIRRVPASGGEALRLVGGDRVVTGVTASRDGARLAFSASEPTAPAEVFVCGGDGTDEVRVTDLNRAWRAEVALAPPRRFTCKRAGRPDLDGWVVFPPGCDPDGQRGRYPALLNIHGGPATQYGHGFFDEFQVYASAGYVVLYTNPRGSQGYGEAFMRDVLRDWGGGDQDDVLAFTDAVRRAFPCIDGSRLGVMGGSYGGYLTSRIISSGRPHPFRAACSERALNAWDSFFGTSDIGAYFAEEQVGGLPWAAAQEYAARSPLTDAAAIDVPLLILHSEDDLRCPIEQAERLYVALKKLDRDVTFVRFPGASHDLSRTGRPRQRVERFRIILDWFARKLA